MKACTSMGLILLLLVLAGCSHSNAVAVGGQTFPPRPADYPIMVYCSIDLPVEIMKEIGQMKPLSEIPAKSLTIGRIDATGAQAASWETMFDKARDNARELGGDALVVTRWDQPLTGIGGFGETHHGKIVQLNVIRY